MIRLIVTVALFILRNWLIETYKTADFANMTVYGIELPILENVVSYGYSIVNFLLVQLFAVIAVWLANLENHK